MILLSSQSLLARQIRLLVSPPTKTLYESRKILAEVQKRFGGVVGFVNLDLNYGPDVVKEVGNASGNGSGSGSPNGVGEVKRGEKAKDVSGDGMRKEKQKAMGKGKGKRKEKGKGEGKGKAGEVGVGGSDEERNKNRDKEVLRESESILTATAAEGDDVPAPNYSLTSSLTSSTNFSSSSPSSPQQEIANSGTQSQSHGQGQRQTKTQTFLAVFESAHAAGATVACSSFTVSCGRDLEPTATELDPLNMRGLQNRPHPPRCDFSCRAIQETDFDVLRRLSQANPYHGPFSLDNLKPSYGDLWSCGSPLKGMADILQTKRRGAVHKAPRMVGLMELWKAAKATERRDVDGKPSSD